MTEQEQVEQQPEETTEEKADTEKPEPKPEKEEWNWALISKAALAAHNATRAYCLVIGDDSVPTWEGVVLWQRDDLFDGIKLIITDPDLTPQEQHEYWLGKKRDEGWKYGDEVDPAEKTHPCIVSYEMLPFSQKVKDEIFGVVVRGVIAHFSEE